MVDKLFLDEPVEDILIEGPVHKTMVQFCRVEAWQGWIVVATAVCGAAVTGALWWALSGIYEAGLLVMIMHSLFVGSDAAVLLTLPKKRISFGPWKAQLIVLTIPRLVLSAALAFIVLWLDWRWLFVVGLLGQLGVTAAYLWGLIIEPHRLRLTELTLVTDRLTADASPIRILHISDLHIERLTRREENVLRIVKENEPDLIVITGDYVNLSYNQDPITHAQVRQLLSQLSAPYGVYATLGSPPVDLRDAVIPIFDGLPIRLMRHDCEMINLGQGRELALLGMDCTHHLPTDRQRLDFLMTNAPENVLRIFLYHSPELMPEAVLHNINLYLCGHTHGGQVRLPLIGPLLTSSQLGRRYVMGLYQEKGTHLYVSRGIGLEGLSAPRVRFLAPPEMTLITLHGQKGS
jgi:predicted MPP superfamily phosphohydrolase